MLSGLLYFSYAHPDLGAEQISEIVRQAREYNSAHDISGQLHCESGLFLQWLEGPADELDSLWNRIFLDRRHSRITKMFEGPISARCFGEWSMQYTDQRDAYLIDYILSRKISLQERTATDASKLLSFLREVATTDRYRPIESIMRSTLTPKAEAVFSSSRV